MLQFNTKLYPLNTDWIVILSSSNWFKELRSNRYHYATRFARFFSVLFVQPDLTYQGYQFEKTEFDTIKVLHVWKRYDSQQIKLLNSALGELGANRPIFWVYNGQFDRFLVGRDAVLKVYHATEDYFSSDSYIATPAYQIHALNNLLKQCQLLVCVSDGVAESYQQKSAFKGKSITISNGCDYLFYAPKSTSSLGDQSGSTDCIALYQGNIFDKLDYDLLIQLANRLPNWQFRFCGRVLYHEKAWKQLCHLPNIHYLGVLTPEEVREQSYQATVGLIPFVESAFLLDRSFPLKAFEYLACGLPVVSIPIKSLLPYKAVMQFASGVDAFEREMLRACELRDDKTHLALRLQAARAQDYDDKVETVLVTISELAALQTHVDKMAYVTRESAHTHLMHWFTVIYDRIPNGIKELIPPLIKRCLIKKFLA